MFRGTSSLFPIYLSIYLSIDRSIYRSIYGSILSYPILCYAMLSYPILCYAMLSYPILCYAMLCYPILCYAMLCYPMLCYAIYLSIYLHMYIIHNYTYIYYNWVVLWLQRNSVESTPSRRWRPRRSRSAGCMKCTNPPEKSENGVRKGGMRWEFQERWCCRESGV